MASPSKLFSCVDPQVILKSPLNSSVSKMHWSFSRSSRFPKQRPRYCDKVYEIPDNKQTRSTSFGYGIRTKIQLEGSNKQMPPANLYRIDSFVDLNKKKGSGPGLGKGRDVRDYLSQETQAQGIYYRGNRKNNPGPGAYQTSRSKQIPSWSLGIKTASHWDIRAQEKLKPGPGSYKDISMNPEGKYSLSQFKNSLSTTWNPKRSRRFSQKCVDFPGPGTYNSQHDVSSSGDYILSKNTSYGHRKMLLSKREGFIDEIKKRLKTPGPGAYRIPSDFGIYDQLNQSCHINKTHTSGFNHTRSQILESKNI